MKNSDEKIYLKDVYEIVIALETKLSSHEDRLCRVQKQSRTSVFIIGLPVFVDTCISVIFYVKHFL